MSKQPLTYEQRVHAAHCCKHGCKYGEDVSCPVVTGQVEQKYTCHNLGCREQSEEKQASALDRVLASGLYCSEYSVSVARAELAALRAQLAEAQENRASSALAQLEKLAEELKQIAKLPAPAQPGTCATCFWKNNSLVHGLICGHDKVPFWKIPDPDSFGCIHHAPLPPGG